MKIKALLIMEGKEVQTVRIPASSKFLKSFIGRNLFKFRLDKNTMIFANKEAKMDQFNRILKGNIILGTFLIIGIKNNHRVSLKKKQIRKYTNMFNIKKQQKKVEKFKEEFLEDYYYTQRKMKQNNAERNKKEIFKMVA